MLLIKHFLEAWANPLAMAASLVAIGVVCRLTGARRTAHWIYGSAFVIGYLGGTPVVGKPMLAWLELAYPPLPDVRQLPKVDTVVVLGSGYAPRAGVPITGALDDVGVVRVVEGVRLMRLLGLSRLVVSGGAPSGRARPAQGYFSLARDLGIPQGSLVVLDEATDTAAEAHIIAKRMGPTPFILVTSAFHMPRAMGWMRRAGAQAIPAPTGQLAEGLPFEPQDLLPSAAGLTYTELALHEYLGLTAMAIGIH